MRELMDLENQLREEVERIEVEEVEEEEFAVLMRNNHKNYVGYKLVIISNKETGKSNEESY